MSGIAGLSLKPGQKVDTSLLVRFAAALGHRGPNGAGRFAAGDVALVQTRLFLGPSELPLSAGPLTLISDGEIYAYEEFKTAHPGAGSTPGGFAPLFNLYARASADYPNGLRGMYAIALHDAAFHTLTLSRDLFGIKPLYVALTPLGLVFASEPQALLESGAVPRGLDREKLHELLNRQFYTGTQSIFPGIQRVAPGETLTVRQGAITARNQVEFPRPPSTPESEAAALARLEKVLHASIALHQRADIPCGLFHTGSVESSVLLALAPRHTPAYTTGSAAKLGRTRLEPVQITEAMFWDHLPEIAAALDDPVATPSILANWFLARRARQDVSMILASTGAAEIFAGHARYRAAASLFGRSKMRRKNIFDGLGILREPTRARSAEEHPQKYLSRLKTAQRADIAGWLPHGPLLALDRCLMAHSMEGRTPFTDRNVAAFAFSLPDKLLVRHGRGKYLLRLWLEKNLPEAEPFAKRPVRDLPLGGWIAAQATPLAELLARQPIIAELTDPAGLPALLARAGEKRYGQAAWALLFTALWHRRHVLNLAPAGDVLTTLRNI